VRVDWPSSRSNKCRRRVWKGLKRIMTTAGSVMCTTEHDRGYARPVSTVPKIGTSGDVSRVRRETATSSVRA